MSVGRIEGGTALCEPRACVGLLRRALVLMVVAVFWLGAPAPSAAQQSDQSVWRESGIGVLSVLASVIYSPVKVLYAGAGTLTAGLAYVLTGGQPDMSQVLLARSLRGDYVITPDHLTRQRSLQFVGRDPYLDPSPVGSEVGSPAGRDSGRPNDIGEPYPY